MKLAVHLCAMVTICVHRICWYAESPLRTDTNMPLTDLAIKRALAGPKIIKLSDGGGLQLWLTPDGAKRWRLAYRFAGAQKTFAIGVYPEVGLKDARETREAARRILAQNGFIHVAFVSCCCDRYEFPGSYKTTLTLRVSRC